MQIGFYRAPEGQEPRRGAGFGQDASRTYEDRQRVPGDYDAQVSIHGGISRHGLEPLASTDRGMTMMRNMLRRSIRALRRLELHARQFEVVPGDPRLGPPDEPLAGEPSG